MALTDNLISYWKFDESSGNASDVVGSNTLTNNNSCTYGAVKINNGVILNSVSFQYLNAADNSDYDGTANFSVAFWIYPSSTSDDMMVVTKWGDTVATNQSWRLIFSSNKLLMQIGNGTTSGIITPTSTLSTSTLYHLAYTFDGTQSSGSRGKVYINGSDNTASDDTPSTTLGGSAGLFVGTREGTPAGTYFNGKIDELGIWKRKLTGVEVSELYNLGAGNQYPFSVTFIPKVMFV